MEKQNLQDVIYLLIYKLSKISLNVCKNPLTKLSGISLKSTNFLFKLYLSFAFWLSNAD